MSKNYEMELRQVRAWMRYLSADLQVMRTELTLQEKRMERLIAYKESLEKEMMEIKVIPEGKSGRAKVAAKNKVTSLAELTDKQAEELMAILLARCSNGATEEEIEEDDEN